MHIGRDDTRLVIDLDGEFVSKIRRVFPRTAVSPEDVATIVVKLAVQEWLRWLTCEDRPLSITDQNVKRVLGIYQEVYPDQMIDAEALCSDLKLPLGQARYILQAISYQRGTYLERVAVLDVLQSANAELADWQQTPAKDRSNLITLRMLRTSQRVFLEVVDRLVEEEVIVPPSKLEDVLRRTRYQIRAEDALRVADELLNALESLAPGARQRALQEYPALTEVNALHG